MAIVSFDVRLRRLAFHDDAYLDALTGGAVDNLEASGLQPKVHALVQIGALIALDAAPASYARAVEAARWAGATDEEIAGALVAALPIVGAARTVSAAPTLGRALAGDVGNAMDVGDDSARDPSHQNESARLALLYPYQRG